MIAGQIPFSHHQPPAIIVSFRTAIFPPLLLSVFTIWLLDNPSHAQRIQVTGRSQESGTVSAIKSGSITILSEDGKSTVCKIQDTDENAISLGGMAINMPTKISVTGSLPSSLIEKGMLIGFTAPATDKGKFNAELKQLEIVTQSGSELKAEFLARPADEGTAPCQIVGRVLNLSSNRLRLQIPKTDWARNERLTVDLAENCTLGVNDDSLNLVRPGDRIISAKLISFSTGDKVIAEIEIELSADREQVTTGFDDKLEQQFSDLSDQPGKPREERSDNFILYTDISERQAAILLAKLETMHQLVGKYFGKRPRMPIECYVISNMRQWPTKKFEPMAVAKILEPAGVTMAKTMRGGGGMKAIVYSCEDHGVVQHEAVHAFCYQAFGGTGPTWYAEGMAEMGQYWKPGELAVDIDPIVIGYLTKARPKKMLDIVAAGQITGDSWQAYAWRWALCHLLANNPNYSKRFGQLGLVMMGDGKETFETAFGDVAAEISFEYDQFVRNFGNGYRVDLCSWDWKTKASKLSKTGRSKSKILAAGGWQATKLKTESGLSYDFVTEGEWKLTSEDEPLSAAGGTGGKGKLIGTILHDFELSEPFELGTRGAFSAPVAGQLYLRCRDGWTDLADNEGEITVHFRRTATEETPK
jgi:hypothetical protein